MKNDRLKNLVKAVPFAPFALVLPSGERLEVPHPDFVWIHPDGHSLVVALKDDVIRILHWRMVTGLETKTPEA